MASVTTIGVTESELLSALAEAARVESPADALTGPELQTASGLGQHRFRKAMHLLKAAGRLTVHPVQRESLDGRTITTTGYVIVPAKRKR